MCYLFSSRLMVSVSHFMEHGGCIKEVLGGCIKEVLLGTFAIQPNCQEIALKLCHHILKVILGEGHFVLESSGFEHGIDQIVDFLFGEFVGLGSVYEGVEEFGLVHLAIPSIQSLSSVFPQKNIVFKNS